MSKSPSYLPLLTPPSGGLARLRERLNGQQQQWYWTLLPTALGSTCAVLLFYWLPTISDVSVIRFGAPFQREQKFMLKNESQALLEINSTDPNVRIVWIDDLSIPSNTSAP